MKQQKARNKENIPADEFTSMLKRKEKPQNCGFFLYWLLSLRTRSQFFSKKKWLPTNHFFKPTDSIDKSENQCHTDQIVQTMSCAAVA